MKSAQLSFNKAQWCSARQFSLRTSNVTAHCQVVFILKNNPTNLPDVVADQMKKTFCYISFCELGSCEKRKQKVGLQVIAFTFVRLCLRKRPRSGPRFCFGPSLSNPKWPITNNARKAENQSKLEAKTCKPRRGRENVRPASRAGKKKHASHVINN